MNTNLSQNELAALESFRVGDSGPLQQLPADAFQRVTGVMSWGDLLDLGTLRQRGCRHATKEVDGYVRGNVQVSRCVDCGLLLTLALPR